MQDGGGGGGGPDLLGGFSHSFTGAAKLWVTINISHCQGEVEVDEGVGIGLVRMGN